MANIESITINNETYAIRDTESVTAIARLDAEVAGLVSALTHLTDVTPNVIEKRYIDTQHLSIASTNSKSWRVSSAMAVMPGDTLIVNTYMKYNGFIAEMDSGQSVIAAMACTDGEPVSGVNNLYHLNDYEYVVPNGVAYVAFGTYTDTDQGIVYPFSVKKPIHGAVVTSVNGAEGDITLTPAELTYDRSTAYPTGSIGKAVNDLGSDVDGIHEMLTNRYTDVTPSIITGRYIDENSRTIKSLSSNSWCVTEPLAVSPGEQYIVNLWMQYNGMIAAMDSNQTIQTVIPHTAGENDPAGSTYYHMKNYVYDVPSGIAYLVFGVYTNGRSYSVRKVETSIIENSETVTVANSDKIAFFGNSYLDGYTIRTHHCIDNLSMWSDYIFYNYAKNGDNILQTLNRINGNQTYNGSVPVQSWGITYGILAMHANDGALFAADPETFYQDCKKCCEAIQAMGGTPILSTEHQVSYRDYGMQHLASEEGYEFWDWAKTAAAVNWFIPFLMRGHPATRTHWAWTYGLKQYIDTLPRPTKSIKLFRKRPDTGATLDAMKYNSIIERSERFVEIYNGYSCMTKATEKYFDRLNGTTDKYETVKSEYQTLQSKTGSVNFGSYALIECITPFIGKSIDLLKMTLKATGITNAYIRRTNSFVNPLSDTSYIAFGVTSGANLLTPGTNFTITGGVGSSSLEATYTVDDVVNGVVITTTSSSGKTTSETDTPVTSMSGVTLSGSYSYPGSDYLERFDEPLCEWDEITLGENGTTDLTTLVDGHTDYDKVSILLVGSNITISDVYFSVNGGRRKRIENRRQPKRKLNGISVLTDTLLDDDTAWNNISSVPKYTPVKGPGTSTTYTDPLPTGVTTVRVLQAGDSIWQSLVTENLAQDAYHTDRLQIRIIARYFPTYVNTDALWDSSEIYEGSYDCAQMSVCVDNDIRCASAQVGTQWGEFIFDVDYFNTSNTKRLKVICDKKSLQIAKVEAVLVATSL